MEEYKVSHLPIVNNEDFLGLISENDIYDLNNPEEALGNHDLSLGGSFVTQYQNIYDVIKIFGKNKLTTLPVLDNENKYLGSITFHTLMEQLSKVASIESPGGIIVIEVSHKDYLLSELANIVESNDAKIISLFITSHPESTKMEITFKVNKVDIISILQTLTRYNYQIKASYTEDQEMLDDIEDNYNSLLNYLSIGENNNS
jgi:CBS domain-containing protein